MNIHLIYGMLGRGFREKRMREFYRMFFLEPTTTVVDLGGSAPTWKYSSFSPRVTIVNLDTEVNHDGFPMVCADAASCPFPDHSFDIAFSNSLIEHLGTWGNQQRLAKQIRCVAKGYYVQTPNKWFPVEPHYISPLVQFVPRRLRPWFIRWLTVWGWVTRPSKQECTRSCEEIRLLDAKEMAELFPEATIMRERFMGLTKSIIAVRIPS